MVLKDTVYDFTVAGTISEPAQCLERTVASTGLLFRVPQALRHVNSAH